MIEFEAEPSDELHRALTVIVLTQDEQASIVRCLTSLEPLGARILVVDSGSTDRTVELACQCGAQVISHPFTGYSEQRNWATSQAATDWVFHVDADEELSSELCRSIRLEFSDRSRIDAAGLLVARRIVFDGVRLKWGGIYPTWHLRIFRRALGWCEDRPYDQHYVVNGSIRYLRGELREHHDRGMFVMMKRHVVWADREVRGRVEAITDNGVRARLFGNAMERRRWQRTVAYAMAPPLIRPIVMFLYRFVFRLGFLDGRAGLRFHLFNALWFRLMVELMRTSDSTLGARGDADGRRTP